MKSFALKSTELNETHVANEIRKKMKKAPAHRQRSNDQMTIIECVRARARAHLRIHWYGYWRALDMHMNAIFFSLFMTKEKNTVVVLVSFPLPTPWKYKKKKKKTFYFIGFLSPLFHLFTSYSRFLVKRLR